MAYTPQFEKEYENGWVDFPSEETLVTAHALDMYDETFEHIEEYLEDNPIIQTATMPTASEDELDHIYQYMGETTATFTQGYFYKCVSDGEDPATYSWQNINVQSGGGGGTNAQWTQVQTGGTKIAEIEIDDVSQDVFDSTWGGTHAEYEQIASSLPDGTKIFFTDDEERVEAFHKYSIDEKVVGEWIDGRPIYEKVIALSTPLQCDPNVWTYVPGSGLDSGVSPLIVDARVIDGNGTYFGFVACNYSGGLFGILNIRTNNNINVSRLIIQYTKSTD